MESQGEEEADVVSLQGDGEPSVEREIEPEASESIIEWTELTIPQPGAYRRMLEILFAPRADDEAA